MNVPELASQSLATAYLLTGFLFAASYLPRLMCMLRDPRATAASHSLGSQVIWTACRLVSSLYVGVVARQPLILLVVLLDLTGRLACVVVLLHSRKHAGVVSGGAVR